MIKYLFSLFIFLNYVSYVYAQQVDCTSDILNSKNDFNSARIDLNDLNRKLSTASVEKVVLNKVIFIENLISDLHKSIQQPFIKMQIATQPSNEIKIVFEHINSEAFYLLKLFQRIKEKLVKKQNSPAELNQIHATLNELILETQNNIKKLDVTYFRLENNLEALKCKFLEATSKLKQNNIDGIYLMLKLSTFTASMSNEIQIEEFYKKLHRAKKVRKLFMLSTPKK